MKFYVRLEQLLQRKSRKFSDVVRGTSLSAYQVKHFASSSSPGFTREVIEQVCEYLVKEGIAQRHELPALLFAAAPEKFWELLYPRERVTMCMGVRRDRMYNDQVVIAADSMLQANVLYQMTQTRFHLNEPKRKSAEESNRAPALQVIDPRLVDTWDRSRDDLARGTVIEQATSFYSEFTSATDDRSLVCLGSVKSNPVIECVVSSCFHATPFQSADDTPEARQRRCPFLFAYRTKDAHPDSACGGRRLAKGDDVAPPGIYYESNDGSWQCAPWTEDEDDAALLMYRFQRKSAQLEMVMGGFSGRGTRCLADFIRDPRFDVGQFWPPAIAGDISLDNAQERSCDVDLGVFVVKFKLEPSAAGVRQLPSQFQGIKEAEVIPLTQAVLESRWRKPA